MIAPFGSLMQADSLGAIQNPGTSSGRFEVFLYREPLPCPSAPVANLGLDRALVACAASRASESARSTWAAAFALKSKGAVVAEPRGGLPLPDVESRPWLLPDI
jgi:hypothetical protein